MAADLIFFALFLAGLTLMGMALGPWMARVFTGRARLLAPVERALYRAAGVTGRGQRHVDEAARGQQEQAGAAQPRPAGAAAV